MCIRDRTKNEVESAFRENRPLILNECTVAGVRLDDGVVLAKNRDRGYIAKMDVVHELIDGVEVVYWHDLDTDWSEGMNEYGIGVVNSSLMVRQDEKESKHIEKEQKIVGKKSPKFAEDGPKIRKVLAKKNIRNAVKTLITAIGTKGKVKGVTGESIISDNNNICLLYTSDAADE